MVLCRWCEKEIQEHSEEEKTFCAQALTYHHRDRKTWEWTQCFSKTLL